MRKSVFDRYCCIKHFVTRKRWRKCFEKFSVFSCTYYTLPANVLKTPLPGQMMASIWRHEITFATAHVTDDDIRFCDGPGMLICKIANSTWIALLIHGFVPVKTWLLIACNTAFYAIIKFGDMTNLHDHSIFYNIGNSSGRPMLEYCLINWYQF